MGGCGTGRSRRNRSAFVAASDHQSGGRLAVVLSGPNWEEKPRTSPARSSSKSLKAGSRNLPRPGSCGSGGHSSVPSGGDPDGCGGTGRFFRKKRGWGAGNADVLERGFSVSIICLPCGRFSEICKMVPDRLCSDGRNMGNDQAFTPGSSHRHSAALRLFRKLRHLRKKEQIRGARQQKTAPLVLDAEIPRARRLSGKE